MHKLRLIYKYQQIENMQKTKRKLRVTKEVELAISSKRLISTCSLFLIARDPRHPGNQTRLVRLRETPQSVLRNACSACGSP